jgi:hypothetical protein
MKWTVSPKRCLAETPEGYRIHWTKHDGESLKAGRDVYWFNAYSPATQRHNGRCIEAAWKIETCQEACDAHLVKQKAKEAA